MTTIKIGGDRTLCGEDSAPSTTREHDVGRDQLPPAPPFPPPPPALPVVVLAAVVLDVVLVVEPPPLPPPELEDEELEVEGSPPHTGLFAQSPQLHDSLRGAHCPSSLHAAHCAAPAHSGQVQASSRVQAAVCSSSSWLQ